MDVRSYAAEKSKFISDQVPPAKYLLSSISSKDVHNNVRVIHFTVTTQICGTLSQKISLSSDEKCRSID